MYHHIRPYRWNEFPLIMILNYKTRKIRQIIFHLLQNQLPSSTYYVIKGANMENKPKFRPNPNLKLMYQVREVLRYHHYAYRTEQTYCLWILRYIRYFGGKTHPRLLGAKNIEAFLSHLATEGQVTASTQRQALNALVFLYINMFWISSWKKKSPRHAASGWRVLPP